MPSSSDYGVPFLIVNYGAEMIFILEQRLLAQNVRGEKREKVLRDLVQALFNSTFLEQLIKPQPLYTAATTRELFGTLAHSSIMRLSESSMDKLYDLMTMGCKYQLAVCRCPRDLLNVTVSRLDSVAQAVEAKEVVVARSSVHALEFLGQGQLAEVRYALMNYFLGKRARISLLMQEKQQGKDGTFVLPRDRVPPPPPATAATGAAGWAAPSLPVGTVQYFDTGSIAPTSEEVIDHPDKGIEGQPMAETLLGRNLYTVEKKSTAAADGGVSLGATASSITDMRISSANVSAVAPAGKGRFASHHGSTSGTAAMSALSNLIVPPAAKDTFNIQNLFDDGSSSGASSAAAAPPAGGSGNNNDMIHISRVSRDDQRKANAELMGVMSDMNQTPQQGGAAKAPADDLLDLLDGKY